MPRVSRRSNNPQTQRPQAIKSPSEHHERRLHMGLLPYNRPRLDV